MEATQFAKSRDQKAKEAVARFVARHPDTDEPLESFWFDLCYAGSPESRNAQEANRKAMRRFYLENGTGAGLKGDKADRWLAAKEEAETAGLLRWYPTLFRGAQPLLTYQNEPVTSADVFARMLADPGFEWLSDQVVAFVAVVKNFPTLATAAQPSPAMPISSAPTVPGFPPLVDTPVLASS